MPCPSRSHSSRPRTAARPRRPRSGAALTRRRRTAALLAAATVALGIGVAGTPAAADSAPTAPLLLVHGFSLTSGINCNDATMSAWRQGMTARGWTTVRTIGWYQGDTNCSLNIQGRSNNSSNTSLSTIAREFAWTVHDQFTLNGTPVAIAAHSMGGLVVRRALDGVMRGEVGFPPAMDVTDVVTAGTPHGGTIWSAACSLSGLAQCVESTPGSTFLTVLADNPQGRRLGGAPGRTEWSLSGSECDTVVSDESASDMGLGGSGRPGLVWVTFTAPSFWSGGCLNSSAIDHGELVTATGALNFINTQLRT